MDVLTWLLLVLAIIGGVGAWLGPISEYRKRRREIEERTKRQILELEDPFSKLDEGEIEKDWLATGRGVIKTLKRELKTAKCGRTKRTIVRALYRLGDKETRVALFSRYEGILKSSKDSGEIIETLGEISSLKMVELAPSVFDRLKREKIEKYEMIRTIGKLRYGPALSYLIDLASECLKEGKPDDHILHACVMAIGDIAPNWNGLTSEELHRIVDVFTRSLKINDRWLVDAVVGHELPRILKLKNDLRESLKKELIETLAQLLEHKDADIREHAVERLTQLGDKRAVPHLKRRLDQEKNFNTTLKSRLEWSLRVLEQ